MTSAFPLRHYIVPAGDVERGPVHATKITPRLASVFVAALLFFNIGLALHFHGYKTEVSHKRFYTKTWLLYRIRKGVFTQSYSQIASGGVL
jgi:hypothetical protein